MRGLSGRYLQLVRGALEVLMMMMMMMKGDAVTASRRGRLIAEEFNAGHR